MLLQSILALRKPRYLGQERKPRPKLQTNDCMEI